MRNLLIGFIPDSALPLVIAVMGLLINIGVVKPRTAFGFIGAFVVSIAAAPFIESLFESLPLRLTALILLGFGIWAVRTVLEFALGRHAAGHVIGTAFVGLVRVVFVTLFFPFRIIARALTARRGGAP